MDAIDSPIFIGGTGRCGTTVLLRLLGGHPDLFAFRWETQFLVAPGGLLNLAAADSGFSREGLRRFEGRLRGRWWRRVVRPSSPRSYEAGLVDDLEEEDLETALDYLHSAAATAEADDRSERDRIVAGFTRRLLDPAAVRAGARHWCEKTPRNFIFVDRLREVFPDMRFLHIFRDPRDVAASMLDRGFWPIASGREFDELTRFRGRITLEAALSYWSTVMDLGRAKLATLPADSYREVRFEALIEDPEGTLREVCSFLGIAYDERLLTMDLDRHNIGRWREDFDEGDRGRVAELIGSRLEAEGYA